MFDSTVMDGTGTNDCKTFGHAPKIRKFLLQKQWGRDRFGGIRSSIFRLHSLDSLISTCLAKTV